MSDLKTYREAYAREASRVLSGVDPRVRDRVRARAARVEASKVGIDPARVVCQNGTVQVSRDCGADGTILNTITPPAEYAIALYHGEDHRPATAARITRALRGANAPAVKYALLPDLTGALHESKMRAKGTRNVPIGVGSPPPPACTLADAHSRARETACSTIRATVREFFRCHGKMRRAKKDKIRAILHKWHDDPKVRDAALAAGWRML